MKLITFILLFSSLSFRLHSQTKVEELTKINIIRTCVYKPGTKKLETDDCVDKKVSDIEVMRWTSDGGLKLISTGGKEEDGLGMIYKINYSKLNPQTGNMEYYTVDTKTNATALIVYDKLDRKIIIGDAKKLLAFFY